MSTWRARLKRVLPFVSLGTGVASALFMNRSPGRAWVVVVAAIAVWVFSFLFSRAIARQDGVVSSSARAQAGRFALLLFSQVLTQQALLFPLPFYLRAAELHPRHAAFFLAYATAIVCTLWDPLYERIARRPSLAISLSAFAAFVGLAMVLPVLGLSNTTALVLAGAGAGLGLPLLSLLAVGVPTKRRVGLTALGMVAMVLLARGLAFLVPPAPLELVAIDIGTGVVDRELVGHKTGDKDVLAPSPALFCHTTIKAPLGLKDALVHVWWRDRTRITRVPLDLKGGREAGFRTWSRLGGAPLMRTGRYTCEAQTESGQVLGRSRVFVR